VSNNVARHLGKKGRKKGRKEERKKGRKEERKKGKEEKKERKKESTHELSIRKNNVQFFPNVLLNSMSC